jgi:C4-dicarboxylate-specific signal transduction histidine kinase
MIDMTFSEETQSKVLAHDIGGILTVARLAVGRLMLHEDRNVRKHSALVEQVIDKATQYCSDTVSDQRAMGQQTISLGTLVNDVDTFLRPLAEEYDIDYRALQIDADVPAAVYTKLQRIMVNLGRNAIQAQRGQSETSVLILADSDHDGIVIDIIDKGPGIPSNALDELKLYLNDGKLRQKRQLGMGLPSSFTFARELGGETTILRTDPRGTHLRINIPTDSA